MLELNFKLLFHNYNFCCWIHTGRLWISSDPARESHWFWQFLWRQKPSLKSMNMCVIGPSRTCPQASSYRICSVFSIWLQGSQQPLTALSKIPQTTSRLWWFAKTFNNTVYASVYFSCHCCNCDLYLERLCPLAKYRLCCAITSELFCSLCTLMNNTNFTQRDIPSKIRICEGEEKPSPAYF